MARAAATQATLEVRVAVFAFDPEPGLAPARGLHVLTVNRSLPGAAVERIPHPSSRDPKKLVADWHDAIERLRQKVTPDPDGDANGPNYGSSFRESDYAAVPARDLPFGVPGFLGDDAKGRAGHPRRNNCVERPTPDDGVTLIWTAPGGGAG